MRGALYTLKDGKQELFVLRTAQEEYDEKLSAQNEMRDPRTMVKDVEFVTLGQQGEILRQ